MPYLTKHHPAGTYHATPDPDSPGHAIPSPQFVFQLLPGRTHERMAYLMTLMAERFEVGWMVSTMLGQFENVVAMAFLVWRRITAILANALVTLVDELLELEPLIHRWTPVPGESYACDFGNLKICHASPCQTVPHPTSPQLTQPNPTPPSPRRCCPCFTVPHPTLPNLARTHRAALRHATTNRTAASPQRRYPCLTLPNQTKPHLTKPYLAVPSLASPHPALRSPQGSYL